MAAVAGRVGGALLRECRCRCERDQQGYERTVTVDHHLSFKCARTQIARESAESQTYFDKRWRNLQLVDRCKLRTCYESTVS